MLYYSRLQVVQIDRGGVDGEMYDILDTKRFLGYTVKPPWDRKYSLTYRKVQLILGSNVQI